jgi:hypothetical protein
MQAQLLRQEKAVWWGKSNKSFLRYETCGNAPNPRHYLCVLITIPPNSPPGLLAWAELWGGKKATTLESRQEALQPTLASRSTQQYSERLSKLWSSRIQASACVGGGCVELTEYSVGSGGGGWDHEATWLLRLQGDISDSYDLEKTVRYVKDDTLIYTIANGNYEWGRSSTGVF